MNLPLEVFTRAHAGDKQCQRMIRWYHNNVVRKGRPWVRRISAARGEK